MDRCRCGDLPHGRNRPSTDVGESGIAVAAVSDIDDDCGGLLSSLTDLLRGRPWRPCFLCGESLRVFFPDSIVEIAKLTPGIGAETAEEAVFTPAAIVEGEVAVEIALSSEVGGI